jgi:hypothetical protein
MLYPKETDQGGWIHLSRGIVEESRSDSNEVAARASIRFPGKGTINAVMDQAAEKTPADRGEGDEEMKRLSVFLATVLFVLAAATLPATRVIAQQATVTDDNLDKAIANAKTPADHEAIAAYFEQESADTKKKADLHRRTAETYRKTGAIPLPTYMAEMCGEIAKYWDKVSAGAEKLAKAHREMAKKAGAHAGQ